MTTTSASLIKNEDGSYSYGEFTVLAPVYDRTTKKHIFYILRNGFVPIRHDGNFLTLKNSIKKLTENAVGEQPVIDLNSWHGLKADETVTTEELLATATPVCSSILVSNKEAFESIEHIDSPLMAALKAVVADPSNKTAYSLFRYHLEEVLSEGDSEEVPEVYEL